MCVFDIHLLRSTTLEQNISAVEFLMYALVNNKLNFFHIFQ